MRRLPPTALIVTALAFATACANAPPVKGGAVTDVPARVDGATAQALARAGATLVDVRRPDEYADGHLPGAINIPYDQIARRVREIGPKTTDVIVYCRSGRRSAVAAATLEELGYSKVHDLGPMSAWPGGAPARSQ